MIAIAVERLRVSFGKGRDRVAALRDVSFTVARGEAFGLVGESGSGKSTVLRALAGLIPRYEGRLLLDGRPVGPRRAKPMRKHLQLVFQDPYGSLHPAHTVDRILAEPVAIHRLGERERRIAAALAEVGLGPEHRFRFPHQLSGGQRQRVAIARALILEPGILLLDEPTSALDVPVQAEILNLLTRLRAARGLTMLVVGHDLAVIAHLCDRVAVMAEGEIVEELDAAALAAGRASHPATLLLLEASLKLAPPRRAG